MSNYLTVNTTAELICFFIGCFCLFNDKQPAWRIFLLYLFIVCLTEISAIHVRLFIGGPNYPLYNVFLIAEFLTVSIFFYYLYKPYVERRTWLLTWMFVFALFYAIEMLTKQPPGFLFKTASFMSFVFVLGCLYFYYLMLKDEKFENLGSHAPFWWINGALIFYFGSTAGNVFFDYLTHDKIYKLPQSIRYIIFNVLNVSLYGCWSYAIICRYIQRKSLS